MSGARRRTRSGSGGSGDGSAASQWRCLTSGRSTNAWELGAVGEERLGARIDSLPSAEIAVLNDRRIPRTKANIDHIVVTIAGIWVIDAKRYKGRPELRIDGGILRPRVEKLLVGRRDCTKPVGAPAGEAGPRPSGQIDPVMRSFA